MKKTAILFMPLLFISAIAFGQQEVTFDVVAPQDEEPLVDRYYTGLGIHLAQISEGVKSVYIHEDLTLSSENGELTNEIYIPRVMPNTPAFRKGFRAGDIITGFSNHDGDGYLSITGLSKVNRNNGYLSLEYFIEIVKSGNPGDLIWIEIKRFNAEDQSWTEYGVDIPLGKIDKLNFVHMDYPFTSSMCSGNKCITFESTVHHDEEKGEFIYDYHIYSSFDEKVFIGSELTDIAIGGWFPSVTFIVLEPGESRHITLRSEFFPTEHYGPMQVLRAFNDEGSKDYLERRGVSMPGDMEKVISLISGSRVSGFVPAEYLEIRKRRNIR